MKVSIVVPIYNEEKTLQELVSAVLAVELPQGLDKEIVLVNDGSNDGTGNVLQQYENDPSISVFHHSQNQGKTAALLTGFAKATGDIILVQDADLEYSPSQYPALLDPILKNEADVVYGSRFLGAIKDMKLINRISNLLSNLFFTIMYGHRLTDINTCFKVFKKEVLESMSIRSSHFAFETEVSAKVVRQGFRLIEVPVLYEARSVVEGKKINPQRALEMFWGIFRFRFFD